MRVDEAVIISLPERTDRREALQARLPVPWPFPDPVFVDGVRAPRPPWFLSSDGAYGCQQSHLRVLASAWRRGVPTTLVLEDDALFERGFTERWEKFEPTVPENAAMVMLGGQHVEQPKFLGENLVRCRNTRRTHAYLITLKAIPLLMRTWATSRRHIDHALAGFQQDAYVYAPRRFLIGQAAGHSDISGQDNPQDRFWI